MGRPPPAGALGDHASRSLEQAKIESKPIPLFFVLFLRPRNLPERLFFRFCFSFRNWKQLKTPGVCFSRPVHSTCAGPGQHVRLSIRKTRGSGSVSGKARSGRPPYGSWGIALRFLFRITNPEKRAPFGRGEEGAHATVRACSPFVSHHETWPVEVILFLKRRNAAERGGPSLSAKGYCHSWIFYLRRPDLASRFLPAALSPDFHLPIMNHDSRMFSPALPGFFHTAPG